MADSYLRNIVSTVTGYVGRGIANLIRKYDANWFVNFLKLANEEDARDGYGVPEPLKTHAWLATAVDYRGDNFARSTFRLYPEGSDKEITSGPVYNLFRDVNPWMSRRQLFRATESWLAYKGEAFWVFDLLNRGDRSLAMPKEIYVIDPRKMTHKLGEDGRVVLWHYESGDEKIPLLPDELIHFAYWNPWDPYRGISRIAALSHEIASDVEANRSNLRLLRNGSIPQGVISTEQHMSPEQADEVVDRWEAKHRGSGRAHRIAVLGNGTTYQQIQLTPADLEYHELKRWDRQTILARLGVPGVLIGATDERSPLSGSDTKYQQRNFWETALIPDLDLVQDKLRSEFFPRFALRMSGVFDLDGIPELHEDEDLVHNRVRADVAGGLLTQNEARAVIGYDPIVGGDTLYTQLSWLPMGEERELFPEEERSAVRAVVVSGLPEWKRIEAPAELFPLPEAKGGPSYTDEFKTAHWKAVVGGWERLEREYAKDLKAWMFRQRSVILDTLAKGAKPSETKAVDDEFRDNIMDESYWQTEAEELRRFSREHFRRGAQVSEAQLLSLFQQVGIAVSPSWSIFDTRAVELINTRLTKIGGVVDTIRNHLGDAVDNAIKDGQSTAQLAEVIREQYGFNASRSATIARTEIGNVIEDSRFEGFKSVGVEKTIWVSARDGEVRPSHEESYNSEPVAMGERFPNGLRYPNDPDGPPEETINCRCIALPYTED